MFTHAHKHHNNMNAHVIRMFSWLCMLRSGEHTRDFNSRMFYMRSASKQPHEIHGHVFFPSEIP